MSRQCTGFTLLELMVAIAIFGLMAAMAFGGLQSVLSTSAQTEMRAQRVGEVQLAVARLERDLEQATLRPVRNQFGDIAGPMVSSAGDGGVELSRTGRPNPLGLARSALQRVAWRLDGEDLVRVAMPVLDQPLGQEPPEPEVVLADVAEFELRFLGGGDEWRLEWPPSADSGSEPLLPRALDVRLRLLDWGEVRRILLIGGAGQR